MRLASPTASEPTSIAVAGNSVKVGTFSGDGVFTCNDAQSIGEVVKGSKQTYTGLTININSGEYIGADARATRETALDRGLSGGSGVYEAAGQFCDPTDSETFSLQNAGYKISLYGTGETAGVTHLGSATLSGAGLLSVIGVSYAPGATVTLAGTGTLAAAGSLWHYGLATLSGTGTLVAKGSRIFYGKVTLSGVGFLSGHLIGTIIGIVTLSGSGALSAIGRLVAIGKSTLSGVGSLTSAAVTTLIGKVTLAGAGTLMAIGSLTVISEAILAGLGTLVAKAIMTYSRILEILHTDSFSTGLTIKSEFKGG